MKKVMVVLGTRPEAIKMCPVIKELKKNKWIQTVVCVTGQHREMLQSVLDIFGVDPEYDFQVMRSRQTLFDITGTILDHMHNVLEKEQPDLILVHGDTTTAFVAALASFYEKIPIGHVEAGLRTYNIYSPFPEEFNRQAVDSISQLFFAPTEDAKRNLLKENRREDRIFVTGNTVIDALAVTVQSGYCHEYLDWSCGSRLVLMTAHRRENVGDAMKKMFRAVKRVVAEFKDIKVIYPVHMNPDVRKFAFSILGDCSRIKLVEPLDVIDFHNIMARSYLILTDSGGIQEEAAFLRKPVLVMRETTERMEGIEAGILKLVGTSEKNIYGACKELLSNYDQYVQMSQSHNPYGDGHASEKIVEKVLEYVNV
ncbi:MAG: UDP-N-acetylglucosamine 2-epimerase (non-hydrolyzing) [Lachnospiraceae bacterium]|jgi:UDP-N-acetylglucosamine 2-epimerase (non-hydrolysing)